MIVLEEDKVREKVEMLGVGDRIDSDHHPIIVSLKRNIEREERRIERKEIRKRNMRRGEEGIHKEARKDGRRRRKFNKRYKKSNSEEQ